MSYLDEVTDEPEPVKPAECWACKLAGGTDLHDMQHPEHMVKACNRCFCMMPVYTLDGKVVVCYHCWLEHGPDGGP